MAEKEHPHSLDIGPISKLELEALVKRNRELEILVQGYTRMEESLKERIKEINCLYGISKTVEQSKLSRQNKFQRIIDLIPSSWQYPEITCAQLLINDESYRTANYKNTFWQQRADVLAHGQPLGALTVCYLEKRPESAEGPFLMEERSLINAIAEQIGRTWEHRQAELNLGLSEQKLKEQNQMLKDKNIALREIMNQVTAEKESLENNVLANVDKLLIPLVKKLKNRGSAIDREYLDLLEGNIRQITSEFGAQISKKNPRLTPRENEICTMVRSGLSSKEIAKLLNISYRSVETYRNYIRKKLGITNKKVNLAAYLSTL